MGITPPPPPPQPPNPPTRQAATQRGCVVSLNLAFENADSQSSTWTGNLGGKNWILPKEINANWFFRDSHWLDFVMKSNTVTRLRNTEQFTES